MYTVQLKDNEWSIYQNHALSDHEKLNKWLEIDEFFTAFVVILLWSEIQDSILYVHELGQVLWYENQLFAQMNSI